MDELLQNIAVKLRPSGKQEPIVKKTLDRINKQLKKDKLKATCEVAGSFAKGVYLEQDFDVDLFVKFNLMYKNQNLSNLLERSLKKIYKNTQLVKGSRDYFHIEDKLHYEIVPVLDIKKPSDSQNITDFSPGHVKWVKEKLKKKPQLQDEIRITKQFLKSTKLYGAESFINGFSGHVVDILVIHYGSFKNLLKAASKWKEQEVIDTAKHYKKNEVLYLLNKSKINNLVIIDPLQKERNASAALSKDNYELFKSAAKTFLEDPSEGYFEVKRLNLDDLKKKHRSNTLVILKAKPLSGSTDVVGTKLYKSFLFIKQKIEDNGFSLIESGWDWDKKNAAYFYFACKKEILSESYERQGPSIRMLEHVMNFKMFHKKTSLKKGKIYAKVKRDFRTVESLAKSLVKDPYVKTRCRPC